MQDTGVTTTVGVIINQEVDVKERTSMKQISLPLDPQLFESLDDSNEQFSLDPNDIKFDNTENQIATALIYIRNLQLNVQLDFSKCDYETKEKWLLEYLNADLLLDKGLTQLDNTILTIIANEDIELKTILSVEEIKLFAENNRQQIEDCIKFLLSINTIVTILQKNKDSEEIDYSFYKGKIIPKKPAFYETLKHLIETYPTVCDAIRLFYNGKYEEVLYEYTIKNISKQFTFYKAILQLPLVKFMEMI